MLRICTKSISNCRCTKPLSNGAWTNKNTLQIANPDALRNPNAHSNESAEQTTFGEPHHFFNALFLPLQFENIDSFVLPLHEL